jgi:hypothetical protein
MVRKAYHKRISDSTRDQAVAVFYQSRFRTLPGFDNHRPYPRILVTSGLRPDAFVRSEFRDRGRGLELARRLPLSVPGYPSR